MSGRVLVAGIGNIFLGDDAFGVEVIRKLLSRSWPESVVVRDFGIRGLDLAYTMMDSWSLVVLVDALSRHGAPGTLFIVEPESDGSSSLGTLDAHAMTPERVLELVKALGGKVPRTLIVGCEPAHLGGEEGCIGLSEPVAASLDKAVETVERLVTQAFMEVQAPA
jgi:hydrogenase maturation protease